MSDEGPRRVRQLDARDKDWWRQATVYQIYPRSFADANGDGMGDLPGVTSRVDYLASLGIDAVWLSPFYPSALADGGYDVDDYRNVDPRLGTLEDFDAMVAALHERGIRVFVDIVPNHSSNRHAWFQEALASAPGSPARSRYIFRDGKGPDGSEPPSDWPSHFGPTAWTRTTNPDGTPGQWYLHLFAPEQPDFNWDNPEVQADFLSTLRFWSDRGVDGFRIDVAHGLKKDMSEPLRHVDGYGPEHIPLDGSHPLFDRNDLHDIYREWRRVFNTYDPPRVAVAEAWVPASRRPLYASPDELGQCFNFDLLAAPWKAKAFRKTIEFNVNLAKASGSSSTWVLSNHDAIRHATRYGLPQKMTTYDAWLMSDGHEPEVKVALGRTRARAATMLILALPGCAYMYQGEELGLLEVADLHDADLQDPIWIRDGKTRKGRDGCRVPIPWTRGGSSFGFGLNGSHLPQPGWFGDLSVEAESGVSTSTLELYRGAIHLRRRLQGAEDLTWLPRRPTTLHFERPGGWRCLTNFGKKPVVMPPHSDILLSSMPCDGHIVPGNTTVWYRA